MDEWIPAMVRSRPLAERRVLLQGPDCRVWYLGERVLGWEAGSRARRVPLSPPHGMFHGHLLRGEALATALRGTDAEGLRDMSQRRYLDFARAQLLQRVSPAASPTQTTAGGSSTQVSMLFWLNCTAFPCIPTDHIPTNISCFRYLLGHQSVLGPAPWRGLSSGPGSHLLARVLQLALFRVLPLPRAQVQIPVPFWAGWGVPLT